MARFYPKYCCFVAEMYLTICNVNDDSKFVYLSHSLIQPDYTMFKL